MGDASAEASQIRDALSAPVRAETYGFEPDEASRPTTTNPCRALRRPGWSLRGRPTVAGQGEQAVMRPRVSVVVTAVAATLLLGSAAPGAATSTRSTASPVASGDVVVGQLSLHPCTVLRHALCGSLMRPWDPTGAIPGNILGGLRVPAGA